MVMTGRQPGADLAPARARARARTHPCPGGKSNETPDQRIRRNERQRLYLERKAMGRMISRVEVSEELVTALVRAGQITDDEAHDLNGIEHGIARVLARFTRNHVW